MSSRGVNKVILVGFLGQDPEIRYMPDQKAVAMLSLATSEVWRDKQSGEQKEKTEWHRVVIFGKLAEIAGEYLRKGSQVYIEGLLRTRKWFDDKLGADRFTTEVVVSQQGTMQMMGSRQQGANQSQHNADAGNGWGVPQQPQHDQQHANSAAAQAAMATGAPIDFDDDIPFVGLGYGASNPAIYSLS